MKYEILHYESAQDCFVCSDENNNIVKLDLFTDATFPELEDSHTYTTTEEKVSFMKKLVGRTIEVKSISPYIPMLFAEHVTLIPKQ